VQGPRPNYHVPMPDQPLRETERPRSRRRFLADLGVLGLGLVAVACSSNGSSGSSPAGSEPGRPTLAGLKRRGTEVSLLNPQEPVQPGPQPYAFDLVTRQNRLVTGGTARVWLFENGGGRGRGPIPATWYPFTGYEATHDRSPKSDLPGIYLATIDPDTAGIWEVGALVTAGSTTVVGTAALQVTDATVVAAVGTRAISVQTPVATTTAKLEQICTRTPVCHLHSISLADALTNGKPTVACFATPLLCESRLCGPVLDEVILVAEKHGSKANVIHVEEFLPGPSLSPPAATLENQSPGFKAWGFTSEPWVIVIDRKGVIRGRLGPGPSVAPEIEAVLEPLL